MRLLLFVFAFAVATTPAYAYPKIGQSGLPSSGAESVFAPDPCGVSHNPHQIPGLLAVELRCRHVLARWRASSEDQVLLMRCDHIALALTDRSCSVTRT